MNAQGVCCPWRRFHPRTWYPDQVTQKVLASYNSSHCQPGWTGQTTGWRIGGRILTDFLRYTGFPPSSAKKSFLYSLSIKLVVYRHCFAVCILGTWTPSYWTRSGHPASSSTTWKRRCRRASSTSQLSSTWPTRSSHHPSYCRELFIEGGRSCVGGYVIVREADDHLQHGVLSLPLRCPTLPGQDPGQKPRRNKPFSHFDDVSGVAVKGQTGPEDPPRFELQSRFWDLNWIWRPGWRRHGSYLPERPPRLWDRGSSPTWRGAPSIF